jgi:hypothetical protein
VGDVRGRERGTWGTMALRDLVMGGSGCAVPGNDGSSSSNPLGGFADSMLGSASKTQARLLPLSTKCLFL